MSSYGSRGWAAVRTGDPVNVAARLEQARGAGTGPGRRAHGRDARKPFEFGPEATIEAKGKEGVVCRPLLGIAPLHVEQSAPGFIGRNEELARLQDLYLGVVDSGEAAHVAILGEPGIAARARP